MEMTFDNLEPKITTDASQEGIRYVSAQSCKLVCSQQILMALRGDTIEKVQFIGGCQGNTTGICSLVKGMKISDVISRLEGIDCQRRGTSCPDQLARVLKKVEEK